RRSTSSASVRSSVAESREPVSEGLRLFPVREVTGAGNDLHMRARNLLSPCLTVGGRDYAVLFAPHQQRWDVNPVQPALQSRVVHIRFPAESCECFRTAGHPSQLSLWHLRQIALALCWIGPSQTHIFVAGDRVHVGDIAVGHATNLDPERIDQNQF